MITRTIILFLVTTVSIATGYSQSEKKRIRQGNNEYNEGNYQEAEKEYRKALMEKPGYTKGTFNLGDAMYEQENYEESNKLFTEVTERVTNAEQKSAAHYNLGNTYMKENKFKESIEEFKNSLRLNPDDANAKYNLEYARKKLKEQQQQQQQNQDKNQDNKDQDKKDQQDKDKKDQDKENQDKKDQDKKDQQEKDKEKQDNKDKSKGDQEKDQKQKQQPQQISKKDAQRMLDALKNDEKKTLQKLQKQKAKAAKGVKSDIDW
jgi:tetratricopeptide (TPR) repeat protein